MGMIQGSPGYVYFIASENGLTKIGCASDVDRRINQLRVNSPSKLVLALSFNVEDAPALEKIFHNYFCDSKKHGEWYELSPYDLIDLVDRIDREEENREEM